MTNLTDRERATLYKALFSLTITVIGAAIVVVKIGFWPFLGFFLILWANNIVRDHKSS